MKSEDEIQKYLNGRKNIIYASDWFDLNFFSDFVNSKCKSKILISEQIYKIGDEKLSSRLLNHWYEEGILEDDRPNGRGWKKFSISEKIWIKIVLKLRGFGLNLKRIRKVKEEIDLYNNLDKLSKSPLLDFHILLALNTSIPVKFIVFESGEANVVRQIDIDIANTFGGIKEDFISIDLNKLVENYFNKKFVRTNYLSYSDILKSPLIKQIEDSISTDDIQSISIRIKDKDYIIDEKFFMKDRTKANALMSVLKFGELVERKNAGKSTYEVTNKKKIKRDNP